jgi:putative FmdB family regulatory protein
MPIYEYRCLDCSKIFEKIIWNLQNDDVCCPDCKGEKVERLLSAFCKSGGQSGKGTSLPSACEPSPSGFS